MPSTVPMPNRIGRPKLYLVTVLLSVPLAFAVRSVLQKMLTPDLAEGAAAYIKQKSFRPLSEPLQKIISDQTHRCPPTKRHALLGKPAIDFTLPDDEGKDVRLSEFAADSPVVLVFYNGYHCIHCVAQLYALNEDVKLFEELGAKVIAISPDPPEKTAEQFRKYGRFRFPLLADPDNRVAQAYGVFEPAHDLEPDLLFHGTFLLDKDRRVFWLDIADQPFLDNKSLLILLARR